MKESRDGAIAATGSRPARETHHRDAPRHREHGQRNPAQLANCGYRDLVRHAGRMVEWFPCLVWFLRCVSLNTPTVPQKPLSFAVSFGEGIERWKCY